MRKLLVILSGTLLTPILLFSLLVFEINASLLQSDFYIDGLNKQKSYDLLSDAVIPKIAERKLAAIGGLPDALIPTSTEIVRISRSIVPKPLVQDRIENAILVVLPYFRNENETFAVTIPGMKITEPVIQEIEHFIDDHEQELHAHILGEVVPAMIDRHLLEDSTNKQRPRLLGEYVGETLMATVPSEWLVNQLKYSIAQIVPYIVGESDDFTLHFDLAQDTNLRLALEQLVVDSGFTTLLINHKLAQSTMENVLSLPSPTPSMAWTEEEIHSAISAFSSDELLDKQTPNIALQIVPYLTGEVNSFQGVTDVSSIVAIINNHLTQLAREKIRKELAALPRCTNEAHSQQLINVPKTLFPLCVGSAEEMDIFTKRLTSDAILLVEKAIPTKIYYTHQDVEMSLTKQELDGIHFVRQLLRNGWTYTESELEHDILRFERQDLGWVVTNLRDTKGIGWTYTQHEFKHHLIQVLGANAAETLAELRYFLGLIHTFGPVIYPLPILLIFTTVLSRTGAIIPRFTLSMFFFAFASSVIFISTMAVKAWLLHPLLDPYNGVFSNQIEQFDFLFANELLDLMENLISDFTSGIAWASFLLSVLAICSGCLSQLWIYQQSRTQRK
jgi:hypothetical protein